MRASRNAKRLAVAATAVIATLQWAAAQNAAPAARDVGSRRQVFIDGRFLAKKQNVQLEVHPPRKTGEWTVKCDRPWEVGGLGPYSSVLHDGKTYHMWYHSMTDVQWHIAKEAGAICYATSKDGIQWTKPDLGVIEFNGSRKNNIVVGQGAADVKIGQDGVMVFLDPNAPADERFRMVNAFKNFGEGLHILSSGDGIHWRVTHKSYFTARPQEKGHHLDSHNVTFWDDRIQKYVAYGRLNLNTPETQGRSVARGESPKLGGFPVVQDLPPVIGPDPGDRWIDYYTSEAIKYPWAEDAYYMFPQVYFHYVPGMMPEFPDKTPTNAGPLDTRFAASRDGIAWQRYDRRPFVSVGMKGEFDWASARMIWGILPDVAGREMYMYYRASDWLHGWDRNEENKALLRGAGLGADQNIAVLSRVVIRREGFVSVRAPWTGGEFTTEPLKFDGNKLVLNVDTAALGRVWVEIQDAAGKPIDGFAEKDCDMIHTANEINRVVKWKGASDVGKLAGQSIRLRFVMKDTDLYAFQFTK